MLTICSWLLDRYPPQKLGRRNHRRLFRGKEKIKKKNVREQIIKEKNTHGDTCVTTRKEFSCESFDSLERTETSTFEAAARVHNASWSNLIDGLEKK